MTDQDYSIEDLERETGIDKRVIRSYIEQGLLLGPNSRGRYARYDEIHLLRLLAIKNLRENRQMSLAEVSSALTTMTDEDIQSLVEESTAQTQKAKQRQESSRTSVLDYLRSTRAASLSPEQSQAIPGAQRGISSPIQVLLSALNQVVNTNRNTKQTRGEHWYRFTVTSDVELSIKGLQDAGQIEQWERISDSLRAILLGGTKHER